MTIERAIELLSQDMARFYAPYRELEEAFRMGAEALDWTRWIPCSERLPERDKKVIVYIPPRDGTGQHGCYVAQMREVKGDTDNFWRVRSADSQWTVWAWSYFEEPIVTHWMPLPEPPEEEGAADGCEA